MAPPRKKKQTARVPRVKAATPGQETEKQKLEREKKEMEQKRRERVELDNKRVLLEMEFLLDKLNEIQQTVEAFSIYITKKLAENS